MGELKTCASCEHCNTEEGDFVVVAGVCTKGGGGFFAHTYVPVWLSGCPDYTPAEPVASAQGDGDPGDAA